jgi:hypothetical protein
VSLRLLYLIFWQALGLILPMGSARPTLTTAANLALNLRALGEHDQADVLDKEITSSRRASS